MPWKDGVFVPYPNPPRVPPAVDKPNPTIRDVYTTTLEQGGLWRWYTCRFCGARYMWNTETFGGSDLRHAPADIRGTIRWHAKGHGTQPGPSRSSLSFG